MPPATCGVCSCTPTNRQRANAANTSPAFRWIRHDSGYQTWTGIDERRDPANHRPQSIIGLPEPGADRIYRAIREFIEKPSNAKVEFRWSSAFDGLPAGGAIPAWSDIIIGNFAQGATYVVIPCFWLLETTYVRYAAQQRADAFEHAPKPAKEDVDPGPSWIELINAKTRPTQFQQSMRRAIHSDNARQRPQLASTVCQLALPLIQHMFGHGPTAAQRSDHEFVAASVMGGRAVLFSNVEMDQRGVGPLFTRTVIIDCGLNAFQRGRLLENLFAFSTQRVLTMLALPQFRLLQHCLNDLHSDVQDAVQKWNSNDKSIKQQLRDKEFITDLQNATLKLTILNEMVGGGISHRARSVEHATEALERILERIDHRNIPGYLNLRDFLARRFNRSARAMVGVGRRYDSLRLRIDELSNLVENALDRSQTDTLINLQNGAEVIGYIAACYYGGSLIEKVYLSIYSTSHQEEAKWAYGSAILIAIIIRGLLYFHELFVEGRDNKRKNRGTPP
ncbi:DUF3422 family protein [Sandaracinobacteroides saxicola]|uniref:DUF3422 family protein n=1 Tax=Sandaracinobacteroides saxicola TaxID=2759707 RepID=A0A7G5IJP5_9SPHN|nr:DUF3422 family protein [Sandaracinobacteroides saxicola]QMW23587.1 DUF3422 family protein [Sandaracinobacteroides saxicola]